jgi:hypothetical protein
MSIVDPERISLFAHPGSFGSMIRVSFTRYTPSTPRAPTPSATTSQPTLRVLRSVTPQTLDHPSELVARQPASDVLPRPILGALDERKPELSVELLPPTELPPDPLAASGSGRVPEQSIRSQSILPPLTM